MTLKLIECIHCGFKFKIDIEKQLEDGETTAARSIFKRKKKIRQVKTIDIKCTNCQKTFEYPIQP